MKDYDLEISNEELINVLNADPINRNKKLSKFLSLLNCINGNKIISIDGRWGSGKTVFLKQLELLNILDDDKVNKIQNIDPNYLKEFRNNFIVYYYNAWQNDYHTSPLLSLIYNLINEFADAKNQNASGETQFPFNLKELLKTISYGFIDLDTVTSFKDLAADIYTIEEKKDALFKLINHILPPEKKLVFIIDELDRCKPNYAIELLEIIKHFYLNERIVFILGTNNEQLSYTISNYYGNNFDGYGYLTKFYNLIIELGEISPNDYLDMIMLNRDSGTWINEAKYAVCNYFKFQMREINRYISDSDILNDYFMSSRLGIYREDDILKYIFLPYCLGLKVKSKTMLNSFLDGRGCSDLEKYIMSSDKMYHIVNYDYKNSVSSSDSQEITTDIIMSHLKERYEKYFGKSSLDWETRESKKAFLDIFSLLSDYIIY